MTTHIPDAAPVQSYSRVAINSTYWRGICSCGWAARIVASHVAQAYDDVKNQHLFTVGAE